VFFRQKVSCCLISNLVDLIATQCDTFSRSSNAVFELSTRFAEPYTHKEGRSDEEKLEAERLMFLELTQVCLWGNATDQSLLIDSALYIYSTDEA
jgi:hypothetical protein